jgi:DNA polymerase delta subunit 2
MIGNQQVFTLLSCWTAFVQLFLVQKRYGYDSSSYTSHPTATLDTLLTDLLSSGLPVHVVPGPEDPVGSTLPQQPFPRAMLRNAAMGGGKALTMETNPCWFELGEKR